MANGVESCVEAICFPFGQAIINGTYFLNYREGGERPDRLKRWRAPADLPKAAARRFP